MQFLMQFFAVTSPLSEVNFGEQWSSVLLKRYIPLEFRYFGRMLVEKSLQFNAAGIYKGQRVFKTELLGGTY